MTERASDEAARVSAKRAAGAWAAAFVIAMLGMPFAVRGLAVPPPWGTIAMLLPLLLLIPMVRASSASVPGGMKPPIRRYMARLFIAMGIYLASLFAAIHLIQHHLVQGWAVWPLALLPGLAIVGAFYAVAMLVIEQKDEFLRLLLIRQILVATAITLTVATVWGFLENFGLVVHFDAFYWAVLWFGGFGFGSLFNRITLGSWGGC